MILRLRELIRKYIPVLIKKFFPIYQDWTEQSKKRVESLD